MRPGAPDTLIRGDAGWTSTASSWLAGDLLAPTVPLSSGELVVDLGQQVPERLTIAVGNDIEQTWHPGHDPRHPLATYGQALHATITMRDLLNGREYPTRLGRFGIQAWDYDDDSGRVDVEAVGLLQRVADDTFLVPESPRPGSTLASEFRRLTPGGIPVYIDPALDDRECPTAFQWDNDRLKALYDIADAWPARLRTSPEGQIMLLPPLPAQPVPEVTFTDGVDGTLVSAPHADARDGVYNSVVCRVTSTDPDAPLLQYEAAVLDGPLAATGPYGVVRRYFTSPLVTTWEAAVSAAHKILADSVRRASVITCEVVPDPRIDLDVPAAVIREGRQFVGWVVGYSLPLTAEGARMTVKVAVV